MPTVLSAGGHCTGFALFACPMNHCSLLFVSVKVPTSSDAAVTEVIGRGHGQVPGLSPSFWWCLFSRLAGCHLTSAWRGGLGYIGAHASSFASLNTLEAVLVWSMQGFCVLMAGVGLLLAVGHLLTVFPACLARECAWGQRLRKQPVPCMPLRDWLWEIAVYSKSFVVEKQISFWQAISDILFCGKRPFSGTVQNLYLV